MSILISMTDMLKAGVHYGHRKSKWHPKMKPYIYGTKNNIHLLDLNKTVLKFAEVLGFLKNVAAHGKTILFVGTKPQASYIVEEFATSCGMPYVVNRWLGGTLTNFETIKKRTQYLKEMEAKKESGDLEVYTKKEIIDFERSIKKMNSSIGGIKNLTKLPDVMFVTDVKKDSIAIKEARVLGIKVVGVCDSNSNPEDLDLIIPANDDSIDSLRYVYSKVAESILEGRKNPVVLKQKETTSNDEKKLKVSGVTLDKKVDEKEVVSELTDDKSAVERKVVKTVKKVSKSSNSTTKGPKNVSKSK